MRYSILVKDREVNIHLAFASIPLSIQAFSLHMALVHETTFNGWIFKFNLIPMEVLMGQNVLI
jgi:hypothetical protein